MIRNIILAGLNSNIRDINKVMKVINAIKTFPIWYKFFLLNKTGKSNMLELSKDIFENMDKNSIVKPKRITNIYVIRRE